MFIELAQYYSYLLFILVLGFSAGVFCAPRSKCKGISADDRAAGRGEKQSTERPEQDERRRTRTPDYVHKSEAPGCSSKNSGGGISSCILRDQELLIMSGTGEAKVDEKREPEGGTVQKIMKAKVLDMEKREERRMILEKTRNMKEGGGLLEKARDSNPRPSWFRSLSVGKPRSGQDSNPGRPSPEEAEQKAGMMERKASLTGEEVKELADAFIARVRQRMRVQRQESLARQDRHLPK